jgi:hypothetical protein
MTGAMTDDTDRIELIPEDWRDHFVHVRDVPERGVCGVQRFIYTCGLLTELTFDGLEYDYRARYCYPRQRDAVAALMTWDGIGDPPGEWIKEKVSGRRGPEQQP